jgi:hypothetical protein
MISQLPPPQAVCICLGGRHPLRYFCKEADMKVRFRGLIGKNGSNAFGIFIIALLLFPSSPSVLCIAPGSHVAIEDIGTLCCISYASSPLPDSRPDSTFEEPGSCNDCTDLLQPANGISELPKSGRFVTSIQIDAECLAPCLPAKIPALPFRSGLIGSTVSQIPILC